MKVRAVPHAIIRPILRGRIGNEIQVSLLPKRRVDSATALKVLDGLPQNGAMYPTFARWMIRGSKAHEMRVVLAETNLFPKHLVADPCSLPISPCVGVALLVLDPVVHPPDRTHYALQVHVHPHARRNGIGRAMVDALRTVFRDQIPTVYERGDDVAAHFYRSVLPEAFESTP